MMRHRQRSILCLLLSLIMAIGLGVATQPTPVYADSCVWDGDVNSDWDTAGNWTSCGSGTPGSGDTVTIPNVAQRSCPGLQYDHRQPDDQLWGPTDDQLRLHADG